MSGERLEIRRDPLLEVSSLVLLQPNATYGSEGSLATPCLTCPVKNTAIANGCTTLGFHPYTRDIRATMQTERENQCAVIEAHPGAITISEENYLNAIYPNKRLLEDTARRVARILSRFAHIWLQLPWAA